MYYAKEKESERYLSLEMDLFRMVVAGLLKPEKCYRWDNWKYRFRFKNWEAFAMCNAYLKLDVGNVEFKMEVITDVDKTN